jgi:hypothetical protein
MHRDYQNDGNISPLLSTKYYYLIKLFDKMTQQRPPLRCQSIEEILSEKHLWLLSAQEVNRKNLKEF